MITRNGVCYSLEHSPYIHKDGFTFVFSSQLHKEKFIQKQQENRDIINYSLSKRFNVTVNVPELADIILYRKIETRGFLIYDESGEQLCQKNLIFGGGVVTKKRLNALFGISTQK